MKQVNSFRYWLATLLMFCIGMTAQAQKNLTVGTSEHGTVTFSTEDDNPATTAAEGKTVTVNIAPAGKGWKVDKVTATAYTSWDVAGARGAMPTTLPAVKVIAVDQTAYTFTMPAYNVQVDVTYKTTSLDGVTIAAIPDQTYTGFQIKPTPEVKDGETVLAAGTDFTFEYGENINVATGGTVTIKPVEGSGFEGSKTVNFNIVPATITSVTLVANELTFNGEEQTVQIKEVKAGTLTLTPDDYTIVTNTNKGTNVGPYELQLNGKGNFTGPGTATWSIKSASIEGAEVTLKPTEYTYDGQKKEPEATVKKFGKLLVEGTDYTVSYADNVNASTHAKAIITGMGNFDPATKVTKEFTIKPAKLTSVTLVKDKLPFTGSEQTVQIKEVKAEGDLTVAAANYTVSGNKGTNVTTYTLTVTAKPNTNYTGSKSIEWKITKTAPSATKEPTPNTDLTYNGKDQDLVTPGETSDGTIQYSKDGGNTWTTTIPTGKDVGDYPVQWKIVGDDNHSDSDPKPLSPDPKIKPAKITSVTVNPASKTYNGKEQTINITEVKAGDLTLTADDYEVVDNSNKGTDVKEYTLTVQGKGNYSGTASTKWNITAASIKDAVVTLNPTEYTYDGTAKQPTATVEITLDGTKYTLEKDKDFTVSYTNNVNAGTAKAIIKGKGNFDPETSVTEPYTIKPAELKTVTLKNSKLTYIFNTEQTVEITSVTTKNGLTVAAANYTVSGNKGTDAKSYTLTVTAKANTNYTGSATTGWEIQKKSAKDFTVELDQKEFEYDGTAKEPGVTVKDGENVLTEGTHYTLEFKDNVKAGINTAKVIVTGIGNYTDKKEDVTFSILRAKGKVKADPEQVTMTYGIEPQTYTVTIVEPTDLENYYFVSGDESIATVDPETGVVTAQNVGVTTIYVVVMGDNNYESMFAVSQVIVKPVEIVDTDVTNSEAGSNGIPTFTVKKFGKTLVEGEDYILEFYDKSEVKQTAAYVVSNPGDYMAVLTFNGNYYGIVEKKFKASGLAMAVEDFSDLLMSGATGDPTKPVTAENAKYDFNGDGYVNIADLQALLNMELGLTPEGDPISSASRASVNVAEYVVMNVSTSDLGGGVTRYALSLEGERQFTAFQLDVVTTGSMQVVGEQAASSEMNLRIGTLQNGSLRLIGVGAEQSGSVAYFDVMGEGTLSFENICFSTQQATAFFVRQAGDATGISLTTAAAAEGDIFGLGGQRQQTLQKGVNIVRGQNGKSVKVLRK